MKKTHYLVILLLLLIASGLFLANYEISLTYYEENKANKLTNLIFGSIFLIILMYILISKYLREKKHWDFDGKKFLKEVWKITFLLTGGYFVFFRPVVSGLIIFLNVSLGIQNTIPIKGYVIDKNEYSGKGAQFELTIKDSLNTVYKFDTHGTETRTYNLGDTFMKEMKKGLFGIIYLE